jgi:transcriptional regulator with XRE-family HTH domain
MLGAMQFTDWLAKCGETRTEIAKRLGVSRAFISQLALGQKRPSLDTALRIQSVSGGRVKPRDWPQNGSSA